MTPKLTPKQKLFCQYYLVNLNATDAAIKAGYSKKTAKDIGCENLAKPHISAEIQEQLKERAIKIGITAESVLANLEKAIKISLGEEDTYVVIKESVGDGMTQTTSQPIKKTDIKAFIKVNELYMKHLGMLTEKIEHSVDEKLENWLRGIK